ADRNRSKASWHASPIVASRLNRKARMHTGLDQEREMAQSKRMAFLAAGIALAANGCTQAKPPEAPAAITEEEAGVIAENTQSTWVSGDVNKIMSLYKP